MPCRQRPAGQRPSAAAPAGASGCCSAPCSAACAPSPSSTAAGCSAGRPTPARSTSPTASSTPPPARPPSGTAWRGQLHGRRRTLRGLAAIAWAADLIRHRRAEAVLAGGAEELAPEALLGFDRARSAGPRARPRLRRPARRLRARRGCRAPGARDPRSRRDRGASPTGRDSRQRIGVRPSRGTDAARGARAERAIRAALAAADVGPRRIAVVIAAANGSRTGIAPRPSPSGGVRCAHADRRPKGSRREPWAPRERWLHGDRDRSCSRRESRPRRRTEDYDPLAQALVDDGDDPLPAATEPSPSSMPRGFDGQHVSRGPASRPISTANPVSES